MRTSHSVQRTQEINRPPKRRIVGVKDKSAQIGNADIFQALDFVFDDTPVAGQNHIDRGLGSPSVQHVPIGG